MKNFKKKTKAKWFKEKSSINLSF